jgi:predicted GNAT family acetyltransferase
MNIIQINSNCQNLLKPYRKKIDGFVIPKLKQNDKIYLLAKEDEYIGMIYFSTQNDSCYINYIHTSENHRRKGHSEFLVKIVMDEIHSSKKSEINVAILPDCGSDKLFSKLGFKYVGEYQMKYICL